MKKFTYILEYKKNVYINQVDAKDLSESLRKWHANFDYKHVKGVGVKSYLNLASIFQDDDDYPTELNFMKHIWCRSILLDNNRDSALINIIESVLIPSTSVGLFSFILILDGGTYISQIKSDNEKKAIKKWIEIVLKRELIKDQYLDNGIAHKIEIILEQKNFNLEKNEKYPNLEDLKFGGSDFENGYTNMLIMIRSK